MDLNALALANHVVLATLPFGFIIFFDFVLVKISRTRDVRVIRASFPPAMRTARWAGLLLGLGVLFGFARGIELHYNLLSGWLVLSYVLLVLAGALGIGSTFRRHARVLHAAFAAPDDQISPELDAAIAAERPIGAWIMIVAMAIFVYVMFAKPF